MVEPESRGACGWSVPVEGDVEDRASKQKRRFDWLAVGGGVIAKRFNIRRGKCVLCSISGSFNAWREHLILRIEHN